MRSVREYVVVAGLVLAGVFAFPASASVGENVVETQQPFEEMLFNPCIEPAGELFFATGRFVVRVYFSVTIDGKTHYSAHINTQGVQGFTLSGVRYVVQRESNDHMIYDSDFAPFNSQVVFKEHYVRLKSDGTLEKDDDFFMYTRAHITTNANGVTRVERFASEIECN